MIELHEWPTNVPPGWVISHHRMAKLGHADAVTQPDDKSNLSTVMARFNYTDRPTDKFPMLEGAELVWLCYRRR